ncbi:MULTISPECIES: sensor histidine kinase KdpD [unclassified Imperialibacter]|uniref:sensor histidine kinase n=1 Tax=unclassified Imperialibacter TaxID=2629706 RepID=UPI001253D61A|nr:MULTISPECIES: HAMP domain-containing sensor histidine kinase [unclassified Imperialibacter]CAD5249113.1 putative Histidine kinase [Imperialibacter sp. 89]CAD5264049.1 putative Histidine kinase [Imperialibacter sp. 75]VVT07204.1 putative Histidine kinase [Imperialibacter sp. EC-SDR9]
MKLTIKIRQWLKDPLVKVALSIGMLFVFVVCTLYVNHSQVDSLSNITRLVDYTGKIRHLLRAYESEIGIVLLEDSLSIPAKQEASSYVCKDYYKKYVGLLAVIREELNSLPIGEKLEKEYIKIDEEVRRIFTNKNPFNAAATEFEPLFLISIDKAVDHVNSNMGAITSTYNDRMLLHDRIDNFLLVSIFGLLLWLYQAVLRPSFNQLRKRNQDLTDALQLNSALISFASHEFKTPLTVMNSNLELSEMAIYRKNYEKLPVLLSRMEMATASMGRVIESFLFLDRRFVFDKADQKKVNILEFFEEMKMESIQEWEGVQVRQKLSAGDLEWRINTQGYKYVVVNLISNALKYSQGKPAPVVSLSVSNDSYITTVRDYGIGIPADEKEHIFKPYKRMSNTNGIKGTGLGLFIVKTIIEKVGGAIQVESTVGMGTSMTVTFPRLPSQNEKVHHQPDFTANPLKVSQKKSPTEVR